MANLTHMPRGLDDFLQTRLSLKNILLLMAFGWIWTLLFTLCGLHARPRLRTGQGEWPRLLLAGTIGSALAMVFPLTSQSGLVTSWHVLFFGAAVVPMAGLFRAAVRGVERHVSRTPQRRVVIVGSGPIAGQLYDQLLSDPFQSVAIVGFADSEPRDPLAGNGVWHLGGVQDLERILMHQVVDDVLIGLPVKSRYDDIQFSIAACARVGVPASYSVDLFGGGVEHPVSFGRSARVLSMSQTPSPELLAVKRAMDVAGAIVLLVVLSPAMLSVAIAIKLTSPGPVLFAQERYGFMKRLFRMYKFRTMVVGAERIQEDLEDRNEASGPVFKIRNDPRITAIGRFLRKSSLDELPQLLNVLTGEMSLVGPRPLPVRDVARFAEPWWMRRFSMRPGITCLWQVSGRSDLGFYRWVDLDLEYIDGWSLGLDAMILLKTIPAVLRGTGAE